MPEDNVNQSCVIAASHRTYVWEFGRPFCEILQLFRRKSKQIQFKNLRQSYNFESRLRIKLWDNIKIDPREACCEVIKWIELPKVCDYFQHFSSVEALRSHVDVLV